MARTSSNRSKLSAVLESATTRFATSGFDDAKWADVARDVGIGQTALYHYFQSKVHCLFALMTVSLRETHERFERTLAEHADDPRAALEALVRGTFDLSGPEILRSRIVVSEQGRLATPRQSVLEEEARRDARRLIREVESDWEGFLMTGMKTGDFPKQNAELLGRAVLGTLTSVWHWYRPGGSLTLDQIAEFFTAQIATIVLQEIPG